MQTYSLLVIAIAQVVITAGLIAAAMVGLRLARQLSAALEAVEQLARRLDSKLDPMEGQVNQTLLDTQSTLREVKTATTSLNETAVLLGDRLREIAAMIKFITSHLETPIAKTAGAAAGVRAGMSTLLEGLRKRKEDSNGK